MPRPAGPRLVQSLQMRQLQRSTGFGQTRGHGEEIAHVAAGRTARHGARPWIDIPPSTAMHWPVT